MNLEFLLQKEIHFFLLIVYFIHFIVCHFYFLMFCWKSRQGESV